MPLKCPNLAKNTYLLISWYQRYWNYAKQKMFNYCGQFIDRKLLFWCGWQKIEKTKEKIENKTTLPMLNIANYAMRNKAFDVVKYFRCLLNANLSWRSKPTRSPRKINNKQQSCMNKVNFLIHTYESFLVTL